MPSYSPKCLKQAQSFQNATTHGEVVQCDLLLSATLISISKVVM